MPLTPPPDYTKAIICAVVGISLALALGLFTRSTIPFAGDQLHSLPHGGCYQDGTKKIFYNRPRKLNSIEQAVVSREIVFIVIISLVGLLLATSFRRRAICGACGHARH
nr:triple gene block protein 2 [Jasmine virus C]